jgi:hypothetical protein
MNYRHPGGIQTMHERMQEFGGLRGRLTGDRLEMDVPPQDCIPFTRLRMRIHSMVGIQANQAQEASGRQDIQLHPTLVSGVDRCRGPGVPG